MQIHVTFRRASKGLALTALVALLAWASARPAASTSAQPAHLLRAAGPLVLEVEPNDTPAQAMDIDPATSPALVYGTIRPANDRDFFKFTAPAGAKFWGYVDTGGELNPGATSANSLLTLYAADGTTIIEQDDNDGTGNGCDSTVESFLASAIAGRTLTAGGVYYVRVQQGNNNGVIDPYTLYVTLTTSAPVAEVEPNDTTAEANPILAAGETIGLRAAAISPAGDVDVFAVTAAANDILHISSDEDPERDGTSNDAFIELLSPSGQVLLEIDNSSDVGRPAPPAEAACFLIQTPGTYFIRVTHFETDGTGTYNLLVAVASQRSTVCPEVTSFNPTSAAPGATITLTGVNFTGVTSVTFANNLPATFNVVSDTQITATVPAGAVTGQLILTKANCPPIRTPVFVVPGTGCPTVIGLSLNSGVPGTTLTIAGNNLSTVTEVRFANDVTATFNVISNTLLRTTVPAGAVSGPLTILRADCPNVQTANFSVGTGQELAIDDATLETSIGLTNGGTDFVVNRLTPTSYPATLSRVVIFIPPSVPAGIALRVLVAGRPNGGENIDNTPFQVTPATVQTSGAFNVFTVPAVMINSGDFVVGYSLTYPANIFPHAIDRTLPSQMRSYFSGNGTTFTPLDTLNNGELAGNLLIRARLVASTGTQTSVSAASFLGTELGPESIVAAFGTELATATQAATTTPLPTTLAGTTVKVIDNAGTSRLASLFFVSATQVNFLVPAGTATGPATITITSGDGAVAVGTIPIAAAAPGLFSANANGLGVASAVVLRRNAAGMDTIEAVARFEGGGFVPVPIDLGLETDQVFLILYGTGVRGRSALSAVTVTVDGANVPVTFAGAQGTFVGLDQINLGPLPRSLAGRGEVSVVLTVDGKTSNTVRVTIR